MPYQSHGRDACTLDLKLEVSMPCPLVLRSGVSMPHKSQGRNALFLGFKIKGLDASQIPKLQCFVPWDHLALDYSKLPSMPGMTSVIFFTSGTATLLYLFASLIVWPSSLNAWFAPSSTSLLILLWSSFFMSALKSMHRRSTFNQLGNGVNQNLPGLGCMSPLSFKVLKTSTLVIPKSSKGRLWVALICPVTCYERAMLIVCVPRPFRFKHMSSGVRDRRGPRGSPYQHTTRLYRHKDPG
ncbi:uncharacterized protein G2W53_028935 [Senna tora]|uniref:Uncharacterized protein n=1 Tax=Senna tora TaxID=362788 RepID=A0A834T6A2_9FABA|nr:uncharacterized protein G2W53_028935 [Senna tora]